MEDDHGFSKSCPSGNYMEEKAFWPECQRCGCKMTRNTFLCEDCMEEEIQMNGDRDED